MGNADITVHMVVRNEDRFVWYVLASVLPYCSRVLVTDTGSSDRTIDIIKSFSDKKIHFRQVPVSDAEGISRIRQEQLENTKTDWFWVVDGDEVYPSATSREITDMVKNEGKRLEGIVVGRFDLLGDIYHKQDESVGTYALFGKKGHIVIRLINKKNIRGLHMEGTYPYEGYYDDAGNEITTHDPKRFAFTRGKLFHAMYLSRSTLGANLSDTFHRGKWKVELGKKVSEAIPEVFSMSRPVFVPDVLQPRSHLYEIAATVITPLKIAKRKIL